MARAQPPGSLTCHGTEHLQIGHQAVGRGRLDGGSRLDLLITLQKNQECLEQALARQPVVGLTSDVEDSQVADGEPVRARQRHQSLPVVPKRNTIRKEKALP